MTPKRNQGYKKADLLAALQGNDYDHNLPESARQALMTASSNMRSLQYEPDEYDVDPEVEAERDRFEQEQLAASMPYVIPPAAKHDDRVLEVDKDLAEYRPRSATKWYKKVYFQASFHPGNLLSLLH